MLFVSKYAECGLEPVPFLFQESRDKRYLIQKLTEAQRDVRS